MNEDIKRVTIRVKGGVAEVVGKDKGVEVTVVDWDASILPHDDIDADPLPSVGVYLADEEILNEDD